MTDWTLPQKHTAVACVLAWTLDAFDFFLVVFLLTELAQAFTTSLETISFALVLTLVARPIGALILGRAAEKYGRKPLLMISILLFSCFELFTAAAPSLWLFFVLRLCYGVAMGGVWGVASSLTMETIPVKARGLLSGIFQAGYPLGYLLAAVVYGLLADKVGWRGLFVIGALPLLLIPYIHYKVIESPSWQTQQKKATAVHLMTTLKSHWQTTLYLVILMSAFTFFSHGTQDLYPTFLRIQHQLGQQTISLIAIGYNISSILGGIIFGAWSQRLGRKKTIIIAALLCLPVIPLWAYSSTIVGLAIGAMLMQFFVQGAWGVIPSYLNEAVPATTRAVLPGFIYQVGNLIAASNAYIQTHLAAEQGNNYSFALASVCISVVLIIIGLMAFSQDSRNKSL